MKRWVPPSGGALKDVMPSAVAALEVAGFDNSLSFDRTDRVVVLLVDGLGVVPLDAAIAHADVNVPTLAAGRGTGRVITSPFPSTTPAGLASLGTGLSTGCHGLVGASFVLPETGRVLWPLSWRDDPHPTAVQPEPTVLEDAAAAGVQVTSISPRAYEKSGLTRAVLRGGEYVGADSFGERVGQTARALRRSARSLTYVYWGDLDKTGHVHGVDSMEWRAELELVDLLVSRIVEVAPTGTTVLLTADHGMLDTAVHDRFEIDDHRELHRSVTHIAGEPRVRHIYTRPGAADDVAAAWKAALGNRATVVGREEAVTAGLFGEVDPDLADRIGDVVVVARGSTVLASQSVDARSSALVGQHGALTEDELAIPLLQWQA
ncbi:MAG: alkaline phosphatase family protein [Actinobacteria bacterium]|nr:alkaline phosphatase family protein [Actinomycetota bacterium]